MSHYTLLVKVSAERLSRNNANIKEAIEELLTPYQDGAGGVADKWDWYAVGGRWSGFFPLKAGIKPILGEPGAFDNEAKPGRGDVVRFDNLDLQEVARIKDRRVAEFYEQYQRLLAGEEFRVFEGPREQALDFGLIRVEKGPVVPGPDERAFS